MNEPVIKLTEGKFEGARKQGSWVLRYPNGQIWQTGSYQDDCKDGQWSIYHPDGRLASRGPYRHNRRHGEWLLFDESGESIGTCRYLAGRLLYVTKGLQDQAA